MSTMKPLEGIRIIDLTHVWAGPLGTRILADLGAEVIKVEAPTARGLSNIPANFGGMWPDGVAGDQPWNRQGMLVKLNRNKKGFCVNLKMPEGRQAFLDLVAKSDVVIENFSLRAMPSLGLGYDALKEVNPEIIYVAMPGFGVTGPNREFVAFGPSVEPMTGLTSFMGYSAEEPRVTGIALPDACAGVAGASAVVTALHRRAEKRAAGEPGGGFVEVALQEAGLAMFGDYVIEQQLRGEQPPIYGNAHHEFAPNGVYPCIGEDNWITLAIRNDEEWKIFCAVADNGWENETRFSTLRDRRGNRDALDGLIAKWTAPQDKYAVMEALAPKGVPAGAVQNGPETLADTQLLARNFYAELTFPEGEPIHYPGLPIRIDDQDFTDWQHSPGLGEHNPEILQDILGMSAKDVENLQDKGVIADRPPS